MSSSNISKQKIESAPDFRQALESAEQMLDGNNDVKVLLAQQLYQQEVNEGRIKALESVFLCQKEIFNLDEAAMYIGVSKSNLYKMTASRKIPHYKPDDDVDDDDDDADEGGRGGGEGTFLPGKDRDRRCLHH